MPLAGYSGTPLVQKLGIKSGHRVLLVHAPADFADDELVGLPADVHVSTRASGSAYDVIVFFTKSMADLSKRFPGLVQRLATSGGLWVAWPKKSSGMATDLNDNTVREYGLSTGLVDNKICAVTEVWSGQRFVIRLADRARNA
ncbi:MAG: DUF3052 domain-containing protein [Mycobacteriales bacterium]|nr:hypothetical protein [Frankia sp.]